MPKLTHHVVQWGVQHGVQQPPRRLPFIHWYSSDWIVDTSTLSVAARGAFCDLCFAWWTRGAQLPAGMTELAAILRIGETEDAVALLREIAHLFTRDGDGIAPTRMLAYRKRADQRNKWSKRANGAKMARIPTEENVISPAENNAPRSPMDAPMGSPTKAPTDSPILRSLDSKGESVGVFVDHLTEKTHTTPAAPPQTLVLTAPSAPKIKRTRSQCTEAPPGFVAWWKAYPNKSGKAVALQSWLRDNPDPAVLMRALAWQVKSEKWTKDGGAFIPMPATYLNQRRYEDEPIAPTRNLSPTTIANQAAVREFLAKDKPPLYNPGDDDDEDASF